MVTATDEICNFEGDSMTWFEEQIKKLEGNPIFEFEKALLDFEETLARKIKPMPPEFARAVDKHFWELFNK